MFRAHSECNLGMLLSSLPHSKTWRERGVTTAAWPTASPGWEYSDLANQSPLDRSGMIAPDCSKEAVKLVDLMRVLQDYRAVL